MTRIWFDGLPLHPPDQAVPIKIEAGAPASVGEPIDVDADGRLVGEIEAGSYELIWQHKPPPPHLR